MVFQIGAIIYFKLYFEIPSGKDLFGENVKCHMNYF